jgi:hypothetical protein
MVDQQKEKEEAEKTLKEVAEKIKDQTIYDVRLSTNSRRFFVDYVDKDSRYYKSFDDYLNMVSGKIAEELKASNEEVNLDNIVAKLNDLERSDLPKTEDERVFVEIPLSDDFEEIERRVSRIIETLD